MKSLTQVKASNTKCRRRITRQAGLCFTSSRPFCGSQLAD